MREHTLDVLEVLGVGAPLEGLDLGPGLSDIFALREEDGLTVLVNLGNIGGVFGIKSDCIEWWGVSFRSSKLALGQVCGCGSAYFSEN